MTPSVRYTPRGYTLVPVEPSAEQRKLIARLKRAEGQVTAIRRMLEEDQYCVDVLTQISAARGALAKAGEAVLANHVETCVRDAFASGDPDEAARHVDELLDVFGRFAS